MQQQTEVTQVRRSRGNGKSEQDVNADATIVKMQVIRDSLDELVDLCIIHENTGARLKDAIKATAEKAGLMPKVLARYVKANAGDKFDEDKKEVTQLAMVFDS